MMNFSASLAASLALGLMLSGCITMQQGMPPSSRTLSCQPAVSPLPGAEGAYVVNDCVLKEWLAMRGSGE